MVTWFNDLIVWMKKQTGMGKVTLIDGIITPQFITLSSMPFDW